MPKYFVLNGHTLGYKQEGSELFGVLQGSVLLGGHDWKNGPVAIGEKDMLVPASVADFERFRICSKGYEL